MTRLGKDQIVTIHVLDDLRPRNGAAGQQGMSNVQIAGMLGVSEGSVRYHLRRRVQQATDGRSGKQSLIERHGLEAAVAHWWQDQLEQLSCTSGGGDRSPNATVLWQWLVDEHNYPGSCKSVRKYVRGRFDRPKLRPFRRVETPPGAQTQSDWLEMTIDFADLGQTKVYGFLMTLSHSRKSALVWSTSMDQLAWHRVHNEAFRRLGGVAAINRIDNLKTGISHGAGAWSTINPRYQAYARLMGFHVDAHEPRQPQQKGKVERRVRWVKSMGFDRVCFDDLEHLQSFSDAKIEALDHKRQCPATGKTVAETWEAEKKLLRQLPGVLPEPFDLIRRCKVHKDCTIRFEGRTYTVPFAYMDQTLEVRGGAEVVQIVDSAKGEIVQQYPRHTDQRVLIDPSCYEGPATDRVQAPKPLGRVSRALQRVMDEQPEVRSVELYAQLAEVCR